METESGRAKDPDTLSDGENESKLIKSEGDVLCEEVTECKDILECEEKTQVQIIDRPEEAVEEVLCSNKICLEEIVEESASEKVSELDEVGIEEDQKEKNTLKNNNLKNCQNSESLSDNPDPSLENGKKKGKEEKPQTKVVVRRLPPSMTKETFLEQVSPLPPFDYFYFVQADPAMGPNSFSRAYLNFLDQEDLFAFTRTFDNYVFLDAKGAEYPIVVEFAPFQRVPKCRAGVGVKKKDPLCGTIENDPVFLAFNEALLAEEKESAKPGANSVKQHYFETENVSNSEEVSSTTPLLEFLKVRRAEKARQKEERREEKRRKEAERKLKQKAKEKKPDPEEEEEKMGTGPSTGEVEASLDAEEDEVERIARAKSQSDYLKRMIGLLPSSGGSEGFRIILSSKSAKDPRDKDGKKRKDDKERSTKHTGETRTREFKNRCGKSYQEERQKQAERREEHRRKQSGEGNSNPSEEKTETAEKKRAGSKDSVRVFVKRDLRKEEFVSRRRKNVETVERRRASTKVFKKSEETKRESNEDKKTEGGEECGGEGGSKTEEVDDTKKVESEKEDGNKPKDPRTERRIRNKDRPSLEIYRPGMGKLSKQRLEKETKALGSSTEVESPSHSPSPN